MRCIGCSLKRPIDQATQNSNQIDDEIKKNAEVIFKTKKVLLLGAGESGKSTLMKQMKFLYGGGITEEEKIKYKHIILCNTIQAMLAILRGMGKLKIDFADSSCVDKAQLLFQSTKTTEEGIFAQHVFQAIKYLWKDSGVIECFRRSSEYQLTDSAAYFLNSVDRISQSNYLPTPADILRSRVKTTGIVEEYFLFRGFNFRMLDVGGQRSERKKWIHCFEDVDAIVFLVALSEYDMVLWEDNETNRMRESMKLFASVCNNRWFTTTNMILFLNKQDVFNDKIGRIPLKICFSEYRGSNTPKEASAYIRRKFETLNCNQQKTIFIHFTCATDAENIERVFNKITDVIAETNLKSYRVY